MKRLLFIICALLFVSAGAFGQGASAVHQKTAQDTTGHAIPKALIKVCALSDTSCSVASTIYSDNVNTVKANPFTADVTGNYEFWASPGDYTVQVSKAGFQSYSYHTSVGPSLSGSNNWSGSQNGDFRQNNGPYYDARIFGCKADTTMDGSFVYTFGTDNLACLNLIESMSPQSGWDIYFPAGAASAGLYWLSDEYVGTKPNRFHCAGGSGYGAATPRDGVVFLGNKASKWIMRWETATPGTVTHTGPSFIGCTFRDATGTFNTPGSATMLGGLKATDVSRGVLQDVNFENFTGFKTVGTAITNIVRSTGAVTVTTSTAHGLSVGDIVQIAGVTDATYNTWASVTSVADSTHFTIRQVKANAAASSGGTVNLPSWGAQLTSVISNGDAADWRITNPRSYSMTGTFGWDTATTPGAGSTAMSGPHIYGGDIGCNKLCVFAGIGATAGGVHGTHLNLRQTDTIGGFSNASQMRWEPRIEGYPLLTRPGTGIYIAAGAERNTVKGEGNNLGVAVVIEEPTLNTSKSAHEVDLSSYTNVGVHVQNFGRGTSCFGSDWCNYVGAVNSGSAGDLDISGFTRMRTNTNATMGLVTSTNNGLPITNTLTQEITSISRTSNVVTFTTSSPVWWRSSANGDSTGADVVQFSDMSDTTNFPNGTYVTIASADSTRTVFTGTWAGSDVATSTTITGKVNKVNPAQFFVKGNCRFGWGSGWVGDIAAPIATATSAWAYDSNCGTVTFWQNSGLTIGASITPTARQKYDGSTGRWGVPDANGGYWQQGMVSELITLSTSGATTDSVANLLPANSVIKSVVCRVTTTITTATDWKVGDATTTGRFIPATATLTSGTTAVGLTHVDQTGAAGPKQTSNAKIRITTTGTPGAGAIRCTSFYDIFQAPTS